MLRCIQLAKNGLGTTYPNPMVGSVIVHEDRIIGEGWHYKAGQPHGEVNAINSVANSALLKDATIYVNLEPCSHFGKNTTLRKFDHRERDQKSGHWQQGSQSEGGRPGHPKTEGCWV